MTTLNRAAYQRLIDEDLAWLESVPRTLERDHVIDIVKASVGHEYPRAEALAPPHPQTADTKEDTRGGTLEMREGHPTASQHEVVRAPAPELKCATCQHPQSWHRLDDASAFGPTDPRAQFRCIGYDCEGGGVPIGTPEMRCGCPQFTNTPLGWVQYPCGISASEGAPRICPEHGAACASNGGE